MAVKTNYEKNGSQYYRVVATVGKDSDGKPIKKEFYGKSKKEAEEKRNEYLNSLKNGLNIDYREMCLGELMHLWLFEVVKVYAAHSTLDRYESVYRNYIKPTELDKMMIYNLKPLTLQRHYNALHKEGKSSSVIYNLNKLLRTFFNYAIKEGYILSNPCFKAIIPSDDVAIDDDKEVDPFSREEIEKIKNAAKGDMIMIILLDLGTGLRRGELLGLTLKDIDLENMEIKITKSLKSVRIVSVDDTVERKTLLETPKTKSSVRTVPLPTPLIPLIKSYLDKQQQKYSNLGVPYTGDSLIFTSESCKALYGKNVLVAWKRILKRAGVRYRKFHNIRHTYATQLFEAGVELLTVSKLLGHTDISITANTYTHVMPQVKVNAIDKLNHLFTN